MSQRSSISISAPPPSLSVVIPLYNCLPLTQAMLASLRATLPPGLSHEILLIDDGSTDGTRDWLATLRDPSIRVLLNDRNLGYAATNNRAATLARGDFLALLNNDLVLQPGWLEPMLDAHANLGARAGLIGNVQLDARTGTIDHAGIEITLAAKPTHTRILPNPLSRLLRPIRIVPAITGACLLLSHTLWRKLGGFDEAYLNGGEDIDLCYRARAAGCLNAVALRSVVRHHVSASPGRKIRDEQNSHRLALRWRAELSADALHSWCDDCLSRNLIEPRSREYAIVLAALAFLTGLRRTPPPEAVAGVAERFDIELARWERMFPATP